MTIKLVGSSSGSVALDAPASTTSGANIEFKLPVADGSANQVLKTDGSGAFSFGANGKLLQTVSASTQTQYSFSSDTYSDTDLAATITPSSTSSKILVMVTLASSAYATNSTSLGVQLKRGSTVVWFNNEYHWHLVNAAVNIHRNSFFAYLDSPSTTSATTYTIAGARYRTSNGTQQAKINPDSGQTSYIIVQEVTP